MPSSDHIPITDFRGQRAVIHLNYSAIALVPLALFTGFIWWTVASSNARDAERRAHRATRVCRRA
jgi:hypothetical protein